MNKPLVKIKTIPVGTPYCKKESDYEFYDWHGKMPTIEETGLGNQLCFEAYGGRLFRSDETAVRAAVKKFEDDYHKACRMFDEDPACSYYETYNFNDLYYLLKILPTHFGDQWGYSNIEDYRCDVGFDVDLISDPEDTIFQQLGEPVLVIEPKYGGYPFESYREV